jgi:uncharacterized lipoprotein YbaY
VSAGTEATVTGAVRLPAGTPPFIGATVRVSLLDVTRADAPARLVAEQTIPDASHPGGAGEGFVFALRAPSIDTRARYVVRAHIDVDGSGRVSPGDYVTATSYPVLTAGYPDRVVVDVRRV